MGSPQRPDPNDDFPLGIPETTPETSGKWCITAPQNTGCPPSGGCVSAASSRDKKPTPEEAGPVLSYLSSVKSPAPEEEESVPCFIKRPVPEESTFVTLGSFMLKSPASEEQSSDSVKNHLQDEPDQNPLKEGTEGTNHGTDNENVQENITNPMDVTSGAQVAVTDGSVSQTPPRRFSTVCASLLTCRILDPSSVPWALKKMQQTGVKLLLMAVIFLHLCDDSDFKLLLMAVIFLRLCDYAGAVECFVGWFRGTNLSNQTLVIRNDPFLCVFDSPSTFPLIHKCFPLTIRMENMSVLQLVSENMSEYLVEYNDGYFGRSKTVQVTGRSSDCLEILDSESSPDKSDRNHIIPITAVIVVVVGIVAAIVLTILNYKKRRSPSGDSSMELAQNIKNQQVKDTNDNTTALLHSKGSSVKSWDTGTCSLLVMSR